MYLLRKFPLYILILALFVGSSSCGSKGSSGGGGTPETEENLAISISPDPGSAIATALGATYAFSVTVTSKMPASGVTITVTYKKDSDGSVVFSQTYQATTASTSVTITGIPLNELGTVSVNVVSKSKASNTASKSFKLIRK